MRGILPRPRPAATLLALALLVLGAPPPASAEDRLAFVGVALDLETRQADRVLRDHLHRKAAIEFAPEELEYGQVIRRLSNWRPQDGPYLARVTPYVQVAGGDLPHAAAHPRGGRFRSRGRSSSPISGRRT